MLQFVYLISGLSVIQKHHSVKLCIIKTYVSKLRPPGEALFRPKIVSVLEVYKRNIG